MLVVIGTQRSMPVPNTLAIFILVKASLVLRKSGVLHLGFVGVRSPWSERRLRRV